MCPRTPGSWLRRRFWPGTFSGDPGRSWQLPRTRMGIPGIKREISMLGHQFGEKRPKMGTCVGEVENSKKLFRKYDWPTIDVTRKSVEETAASIVKIYDIKKEK